MKKYDLVYGREYVTSNGDKKTKWTRVGVAIIDGDKLKVHIDSVPTNWNGWLYAYINDNASGENGNRPKNTNTDKTTKDDDYINEEDIPF